MSKKPTIVEGTYLHPCIILAKGPNEYCPTADDIAEADRWWHGLKPLTKIIIMEDYQANEIGGERR